ncbi:hypothetical protein [Albimonas pacifica]|uniref:Uncharacterized protein n=1 Tax=Albimonas pacifica TaxID=1114924 RepID=A0A1I3FVL1_9RHOB|nr:hypothetical protein [Albimonas pacifica]SFI15290.1 hypothetical protein SAMN05216258_104549 [Albimonas pacifica]
MAQIYTHAFIEHRADVRYIDSTRTVDLDGVRLTFAGDEAPLARKIYDLIVEHRRNAHHVEMMGAA